MPGHTSMSWVGSVNNCASPCNVIISMVHGHTANLDDTESRSPPLFFLHAPPPSPRLRSRSEYTAFCQSRFSCQHTTTSFTTFQNFKTREEQTPAGCRALISSDLTMHQNSLEPQAAEQPQPKTMLIERVVCWLVHAHEIVTWMCA